MKSSNYGKRQCPHNVHLNRIRDMPAHIKASLLGSSVTIPIQNGRLALGTWQGIYLGEHRDFGGGRRVIATINGE
ncbi:secondary thiamine-phosphate synthase enzyme YjbQ [Vibrio antiquarius]|uniref:secondary thiamine-phosphate synthase enzyme YjbQ n=1 Tax=Vibrio antiquarius (strain Ex25) TaxID=150340 RepID=UPI002659FDB3|nr:secondary thiamine-phosphate synthase enzyme YjbQ [Vibrio antiquarius]MCS0024273.1 secondary thiamine-phosphate synthase enzyme YjbQ [Vibrio antiquarius]